VTYPLVVLTGLDGSGKDYVAEALHDSDPGSHLLRTPGPPFTAVRSVIDLLAQTHPAVHYHFYLASVLYASAQARSRLATGTVYMVRYLLDTVCYHRALGVPAELQYVTPLYDIRSPDLTIFLNAPEGLRRARLARRGPTTIGDRLVEHDDLRRRILTEYRRHEQTFVRVDNSGRLLSEVLADITKLQRGLPGKVDTDARYENSGTSALSYV
jgi:thymidylate kinase